ncbi:MAG: branched-chain amino acid ABC transporter permease [Actinobacteria bacterium]|nr:branched-chain amino acid ABC transporter permease [Actinomycetota bacterium]
MGSFLDYFLGGIANGAVIALMALALVLVWRSTRVVNFAQVGQAMFTSFIALTAVNITGSWLIGLIVGIIAGGILGFIVHVLVMRPVRRADASGAIIATFGVLIALQSLAAMIWTAEPRAYPTPIEYAGLTIFGRVVPLTGYDVFVFIVMIVLVLFLTILLTKTKLGLSMRASAFNPEVARLSGVRVSRMLAIGWIIAGMVGAVAGVLIAPISSLSPNTFDIFLVFAFTAAVIGGLDSLVGAVAFGIGTGLILSLVTGYSDASNAPIVALILLALNLWFKPDGAFSHHKARSV